MKTLRALTIVILFQSGFTGFAQIKQAGKRTIPTTTTAQPSTVPVDKKELIKTLENKTTIPMQSVDGFVKLRTTLPFTTVEKDYWVKRQPIDGAPGYYNYILDGDIIVGNNMPATRSHAVSNANFKWSGDIPIYQHKTVADSGMCENLNKALAEIQGKTKVRFVAYTDQTDYIQIRIGDPGGFRGGVSRIGKGGGMQEIIYSKGVSPGLMVHELLHALGVYHEQSRPDRDNYVEIIDANIEEKAKHNFNIVPGITTGNYDYGSIMHYFYNAFGKDEMQTIKCKSNGAETACPGNMGQQNGLSANDIIGLNSFYSSVSFSNVVTEKLLPPTGSYHIGGSVSWDTAEVYLPEGVSLDDAITVKATIPAKAKMQTNFCSGKEEAISFSSETKEIYPDIEYESITGTQYRRAFHEIKNLPIDYHGVTLNFIANHQWLAGSKLLPKPRGKNVQLLLTFELARSHVAVYTIRARWFDYDITTKKMPAQKIEKKPMQSDGPLDPRKLEQKALDVPVKRNIIKKN